MPTNAMGKAVPNSPIQGSFFQSDHSRPGAERVKPGNFWSQFKVFSSCQLYFFIMPERWFPGPDVCFVTLLMS